MIKLICAIDKNDAIGYGNDLLFRIPADLKRFRQMTENNHVLMGRKTFQSLPYPLPNRINTVLSRDGKFPHSSDVFVMDSVEKVINHYRSGSQDKHLYVIGGEGVFEAFLPYADEVHLTYIDKAAEKADTFFNRKMLEEHYFMTGFKKNYCEKNDLDFYYVDYKNKSHYVHRLDEFRK